MTEIKKELKRYQKDSFCQEIIHLLFSSELLQQYHEEFLWLSFIFRGLSDSRSLYKFI